MMLPIVARRSPAITTPPGNDAATIVVPCGARSPAPPAGRVLREGSSSGACSERNSANDEEPGTRYPEGRRPSACRRSFTLLLSALLDKGLHEVLCVGLEHLVDLVEDRVDVLVELLLALDDGVLRSNLGRVLGFRALLWLLVLLRHQRLLASVCCGPGRSTTSRNRPYLVRAANKASAVSQRSSSSPTCDLLPRNGSIVGTRCSDSWPGRSKITESQDAAAIWSAYFSRHLPRK